MTVAGLVLAAGGGSRFRGPTHKLLATYRGRPLVAAALEAAAGAQFDELAVVGGAIDLPTELTTGVFMLHNPDWREGLASSLRVGVDWCRRRGHDVLVIGLGDTPGVPASAWLALRHAAAALAVADFGGRLRPPVRIAAAHFDELPVSGDVGARGLWSLPGTVRVACDGDPSDVDTVDDLRALETREAIPVGPAPPAGSATDALRR